MSHVAGAHPTGQPGGPVTTTRPVAGMDRRFQAFAIDRLVEAVVIGVVGLLVWLVVGEVWPTVWACVGAGVVLWLVMAVVLGVSGTSLGKRAVGLRVVHHGTGTPIGVGPALLRSFVLLVSGIPTFGIGLATLAWTAVEDRGRERRGLHDHWASSVVVDERPVVATAGEAVDQAPRHVVNLTAMRLVPAPAAPPVPTPPRSSEHTGSRQSLPTAAPTRPAAPVGPPPGMAAPPAPSSAPPAQPYVPTPPAAAPAPASSGPPPQAAAVRWRAVLDDGQSFVIAGTVLLGRRPEARAGDVAAHVVPLASGDMSVSKTHAKIGPVPDGSLVVMDRGSTNGTLVVRRGTARKLAPGRPATLLDGDEVVLGDRRVTVRREA